MRRPSVGLLAAGVLALSGCGGGSETADRGFISGDGRITTVSVADRQPPGEVAGETLEGKDLALADYAGKVVVLNVWGSWCAPCRKEAPVLEAAAAELAEDDVQFVGINTRDSSTSKGLAFQRRFEVSYPSLYDPSGRSLLAFRGTLNPKAVPTTLVLDREGRVAARIVGEVTSSRTLVDLVRDVAASADSAGTTG